MARSSVSIISIMLALTAGNITKPIYAAGANNSHNDISTYVDPQKIAINPILLQTDDVSDYDFSRYAPEQNEKSILVKDSPIPPPTFALSALEKSYSERLRSTVLQFGYDALPQKPATTVSAGAAQDSYILEAGDELSVLIRGQDNITTTTTITNDGQLVITDMPPIQAAGRNLKSVTEELKLLLGSTYNKDVFLTLTKVRQMSIMVIGNVAHAGQVTLSTFNTVLDALAAAGGVQKTGTLRQIKLIRNNQGTIIDLYGVLVYGSVTSDLSLRDGDKIIVGTLGPSLAVAGAVKRPAIYEILPANRALFVDRDDNSQKLSRDDLLDFAGGALTPANTRYLRFDVNNSDTDVLSDVPNGMLRIFSDGDILYVGQANKNNSTRIAGSIEVRGAIPSAGIFALAEIPSLSYILKNKNSLNSDAYPLLGVVERWNSAQMAREFIPFSPQRIISGKDDINLDESDNVIFFSRDDIRHMQAPAEQNSGIENEDKEKPNINLSSPNYSAELQNFLTEHSVFLRGSVHNAGSYPIANETSLESLLSVAGGPSLEASLSNIEITQPLADKTARRSNINLASMPASLITLHPGDTIRVNQKFRKLEDRHVLLAGEVKNPGHYDLIAGDTLSSLIARAGGMTEQAYPKGAIFSRKSERLREEERYKNEARALELSLANAMQLKDTNNKPNPQEIALAQDLIAQLKGSETLGRLTVEADPTLLTSNPDLDILLESGDKIYVPKRPLTVRVAGEVLSPAALQFRTGKSPRDYINESGGFTYNADSDRAFVVYPNGSAQPLSVSAWNQSAVMIPPGSTIIVPRDPKPLTFMDGAKDLSQILANLATTAIFAEDLRDKN